MKGSLLVGTEAYTEGKDWIGTPAKGRREERRKGAGEKRDTYTNARERGHLGGGLLHTLGSPWEKHWVLTTKISPLYLLPENGKKGLRSQLVIFFPYPTSCFLSPTQNTNRIHCSATSWEKYTVTRCLTVWVQTQALHWKVFRFGQIICTFPHLR